MAKDARERTVAAAAEMISTRGVVPTSMRELAKAGGPLGSIYHYFPDGKDQLTDEAIQLVGRRVERLLERVQEDGALAAYEAFVDHWRTLLTASDFRSGCPVLAVATDGTAQAPRAAESAAEIFQRWQKIMADTLVRERIDAERAERMAWLVISGLEGALAVARGVRSLEPFEQAAAELREVLVAATGSGEPDGP